MCVCVCLLTMYSIYRNLHRKHCARRRSDLDCSSRRSANVPQREYYIFNKKPRVYTLVQNSNFIKISRCTQTRTSASSFLCGHQHTHSVARSSTNAHTSARRKLCIIMCVWNRITHTHTHTYIDYVCAHAEDAD